MAGTRRAITLVTLMVWAELALIAYGLVPNNLKVIAIFFSGLPLGMVWGLCIRYLEGRRASEVMVAGLSCSYIIAGAASTVTLSRSRSVESGFTSDFSSGSAG